MQNIGRVFNQEWTFPIRSPRVEITLKKGSENETWYIRYSHYKSAWKIDNKVLTAQNMQISAGGMHFFLNLPPLSDEYLFEIENLAQIVLDAKDRLVTFEDLYKQLRKKIRKSKIKSREHYQTLLSFSKCFIKISISDTIGNTMVVWRVHKEHLKNFQAIKRMVQHIKIDSSDVKETVHLSYMDKQKRPKRPRKTDAQAKSMKTHSLTVLKKESERAEPRLSAVTGRKHERTSSI
ncbi:hypothetical protein NEMIN01_0274 [Nematocida minor]|uniref:uncharacterized protein n=1 Tax=Nematocida minor TaxID=1912983 RepID=UPI00221ECA66|nr:uncharacterized protein NEMIN01_0274 [Nematocida minor]KAI5189108.1 hypothetical protein NEMIN01_0274 [Nematocida minor]